MIGVFYIRRGSKKRRMKRIVLLDHYTGSPEMGMEFRPYYMAKEWIKLGYDVRIVGGDYSHLRIRNPEVSKDFVNEEIDGIHYTWVRTGRYKGNGIGRALSMIRFVGKIFFNAKKLVKLWKPDVVIASSTYPLDTYVAQRMKKLCGCKVIHEIHDMWPAVLIGIFGMKKSHPFVQWMQIAENSFCKNSDYIVSLQPNTKTYLLKHGMAPEKWRNINNGVVLSEWENPQSIPDLHKNEFDRLHNEGKFVIVFFGTISKSYALNYLIKALQKLNNEKIAAVIIGDENSYQKHLRELSQKQLADNFIFLPKVSKLAVPNLLKEADALYVASVASWVMQFGISMNKLFDSMMSGKPIIYAMGAPNNYIKEYNCGISVEPENIEALARGIEEMFFLSVEERKKLGENGHNAAINHFTYEKLGEKFAELF